jgi:hypothetical protein
MCANYPQESRKNDGQLSKSAHGPTSAGLFFSAQALSRGFLRDASVTTAEPAIFEFVINLKTAKALAEEVPADEARAFSYIACQLSPHVPTWPVAALLSINGGLRLFDYGGRCNNVRYVLRLFVAGGPSHRGMGNSGV